MKNKISSIEQGQRIREIRNTTCLSRRAFSRKYKIPLGTLQNWEDGKYKDGISNDVASQLIAAFLEEGISCTKEFLLNGTGVKPYKTLLRDSHDSLRAANKTTAPAPDSIMQQTLHNAEKNKIDMQLYEATIEGDINKVQHFIEKAGSNLHTLSGTEIHFFSDAENSLLHVAVIHGHINIVNFLLGLDVNVDVRNRRRQTPLHWASYYNRVDIVTILLEAHGNIDAVEDEGGAPLAWAAYMGCLEVTKLLLKRGAHLNTCDSQSNTPLHWACFKGHTSVVKYLVKQGSDLKRKNSSGLKPMDIAIKNGQLETVIFLLDT